MTMAQETVSVRMYRGILGDCFLIRHVAEGKTSFILIDCGVLQGVEGGRDRIRAIAENVLKECGGTLDLVVVTHEHADHLSGFGHAARLFFGDRLKIGKLWLAWTENDQDPQAQALRARFTKAKHALAVAAQLKDHGLDSDRRVQKVAALHSFIGFDADEQVASGQDDDERFKGPWTGARVIEQLKVKAGASNIEYLEPGEIRPAGAEGRLKAYVLGPPRDEARLRKDSPSKGPAKEVYLAGTDEALAVASGAKSFLERLLARRKEKAALPPEDAPDPSPFARPHQRGIPDARQKSGMKPGDVEYLYYSDRKRQIDNDWLDAAEALALKMDSDTNNTSLVLAFELPDRQVLLFAADAQVGNWLSWGDQTYPREAMPGGPPPIVVDDLLSRVTLYKVGHHASHNATLRDRGLEKMTDKRLIALIPVVAAVAAEQGKGWKMPYPELEERLLEKTGRRVLRGDDDNLDREKAAFENSHAHLEYEKEGGGGLWVEVTIPCGP